MNCKVTVLPILWLSVGLLLGNLIRSEAKPPPPNTIDLIRTHHLEILDASGKVSMVLGTTSAGSPIILLKDKTGATQASLSVEESGIAALSLQRKRGLANLMLSAEGKPTLYLRDQNAKDSVTEP